LLGRPQFSIPAWWNGRNWSLVPTPCDAGDLVSDAYGTLMEGVQVGGLAGGLALAPFTEGTSIPVGAKIAAFATQAELVGDVGGLAWTGYKFLLTGEASLGDVVIQGLDTGCPGLGFSTARFMLIDPVYSGHDPLWLDVLGL